MYSSSAIMKIRLASQMASNIYFFFRTFPSRLQNLHVPLNAICSRKGLGTFFIGTITLKKTVIIVSDSDLLFIMISECGSLDTVLGVSVI